ncbi:MAG: DUF1499 domain-containing protein [Alphaproteobacteria bacterium]|nr:DUF1499 domain-containing protein [Alphaproteobacteria bacterium]
MPYRAALIIAPLALALIMWDGRVLEALLPIGEVAPFDFANFTRSSTPNDFLACRPSFCQLEADIAPPILALPLDRLVAVWERVIAAEPRVTQLRADSGQGQFEYVQRTPAVRFPDLVTVRLYSIDPGRSAIALYSRSIYGRGDLGTNRRRVERWLARLRAELARG